MESSQHEGLNDLDFKFGLTKVFFRPGKFAEFDTIMRSDPDHLQHLVAKVKSWLLRARWRKAQWGALSVIKLKNKMSWRAEQVVILQKNFKMMLSKRQHAPRYRGVIRLKTLMGQINVMKQVAMTIQGAKRKTYIDQAL
jgi:myosin-6